MCCYRKRRIALFCAPQENRENNTRDGHWEEKTINKKSQDNSGAEPTLNVSGQWWAAHEQQEEENSVVPRGVSEYFPASLSTRTWSELSALI